MKLKQKDKTTIQVLFLTMLIGFIIFEGLSFVEADVNEYGSVKQNECVLLKQVCGSCSYVNVTVSYPNSSLAITNKGMASQGGAVWTYNFCNTSELGRYDVNGEGDISGSPTGFDVLWFDVTPNGENNGDNQGYIIIGQLGVIALLLTIGLSFDKAKWKIRSAFFMLSLLMGAITLNSIRILAGSSNTLNSMGSSGLLIGILILSFMFLFVLINYTIEVFMYFKKKNIKKWEVEEQV